MTLKVFTGEEAARRRRGPAGRFALRRRRGRGRGCLLAAGAQLDLESLPCALLWTRPRPHPRAEGPVGKVSVLPSRSPARGSPGAVTAGGEGKPPSSHARSLRKTRRRRKAGTEPQARAPRGRALADHAACRAHPGPARSPKPPCTEGLGDVHPIPRAWYRRSREGGWAETREPRTKHTSTSSSS